MKKSLLSLALLTSMFCFACDDTSTPPYGEYCQRFILNSNFDFSSLNDDQKQQLNDAGLAACTAYYENYPVCRDEITASLQCYIKQSDSYIMDIALKEAQCEMQLSDCYFEEARDVCDKQYEECLNSANACRAEEDTNYNCYMKNASELTTYSKTTDTAYNAIEDLLSSWHLDIDNYYIGE